MGKLPPKHGPWRVDAKQTWTAWGETVAARGWDEAQWSAAGRLLQIVHDLAGEIEDKAKAGLLAELRRGELDLGLRERRAKPEKEAKAVRIAEMQAKADEADALRTWNAGGRIGPRPQVPLFDAMQADRRETRQAKHDAEPVHHLWEGTEQEWRAQAPEEREVWKFQQWQKTL